jgi:hypothetical protein
MPHLPLMLCRKTYEWKVTVSINITIIIAINVIIIIMAEMDMGYDILNVTRIGIL